MIQVQNLSKRYVIGHRGRESYSTLREAMVSTVKRALGLRPAMAGETKEEFWALRDIAFSVKQGERLGIIGRNGAGKSTLLKILSRITEPTTGRIEIRGRVASLLEVGTGFHPELTGRENIYLNGAILGMSRDDIRRRFDEIVDFAEVERFLDTPVKRYSSGMYVRLAFAVAAHLEPEVLIVDEVLAVGDAQFQKKCLGKMDDASKKEGRTVLFVSHNMSTLKSLCSSILYLRQGELVRLGEVEPTIAEYLNEYTAEVVAGRIPRSFQRAGQTGEAFFTQVAVADAVGTPKSEFHFGESITVKLELEVLKDLDNCILSIVISGASGESVLVCAETDEGIYKARDYGVGRHCVAITLSERLLPLAYSVSAFIARYHNGEPVDWIEHVAKFSVSGVGMRTGSDYPWGRLHGYVEPRSMWRFEPVRALNGVET